MKKLLLISTMLFSISAMADVESAVTIDSESTEARFNLTETTGNGELSQLFDQMNLLWIGSGNQKTKSFALKSGRFGFTCSKGYFASTEPWTTCTFFMKQGENKKETNTFIAKISDQIFATLVMSEEISHELHGIFPTDPYNLTSYVLNSSNGTFYVQGSTSSELVIGFTAR